jgi:hypothetical protein
MSRWKPNPVERLIMEGDGISAIARMNEECGPRQQPEWIWAFCCEFDAEIRLSLGRFGMGRHHCRQQDRFTESRRGAVVIVQQAAQALAPLDHACVSVMAHLWAD